MAKDKIVIFTYSLGGAGAEKVAANLLNNLSREKYDIHLVLMNTDIEYEIKKDQKIHFIEKAQLYENELWKFIKIPLLAYRLARYCNKENIKLVLAIMNRPNLIACLSKMFGIKAKVLISERSYTPYSYNTSSLAGKIKVATLKWAYPKADAILPNSRGTVEALQNYYGIKSKFTVVKNPVDINKIQQLMMVPVEETLNFEKFTFLNVAAFRPEKNQQLLIDVIAQMKHLDFQMIFIGKGPQMEAMKQKVDDLQLDEKIIFINFTENPYKYMHKVDCFLLSSFSEGFPNVLLESMVCGLPIISVDCKVGPRELLAPGTSYNTVIGEDKFELAKFGILTAPNSTTSMIAAMKWALLNPEKLKEFKEKTVENSYKFEIENVCNEFSEIFDSHLIKV